MALGVSDEVDTMIGHPKPERRTAIKRREKRLRFLKRRQCRDAVYDREQMICQRCQGPAKHPRDTYPSDPEMAHVNELVPRSLGGDPCDLANLELVHQKCHMPNGEHAPTPERQRRLRAIRRTKAA